MTIVGRRGARSATPGEDRNRTRISLRIPDEDYDALKRRAEAEHTTVSAVITSLIRRDPRLYGAGVRVREDIARYGAQFAEAFPDEEPDASARRTQGPEAA